jgi:putative oligomerization/nucleic acid binding protein
MRNLSAAGQQAIEDVARRHGFGADAVASMLQSVVDGRGSMAQFSHPEFGGSGQWMRGGMIMVSDMFNNVLKGRIDGLCNELSALVANEPAAMRGGSFQSQSQGDAHQPDDAGGAQQQGGSDPGGPVSLFVGSFGGWWPADLGRPESTGAQNNVRYAYFATPHRLAIEANGVVTIYDTLDHLIGGFGQQQSHGASLTFSSQHGLVDVASLPVVPVGGGAKPAAASTQLPPPMQQPSLNSRPAAHDSDRDIGILATIEKLAGLRDKGILSDQEFAAKKAELLSRI